MFKLIVDSLRSAKQGDEVVESRSEDAIVDVPPCANVEPEGRIDVLLAEDNTVNRIFFAELFELAGWSYIVAENGEQAVELFQMHQPRVICMDVSMPVVSGVDATKKIREIEAGGPSHVPIIGITAHALEGDRESFLAAGMDDYLAKPVSHGALMGTVTHWLAADQKKISA